MYKIALWGKIGHIGANKKLIGEPFVLDIEDYKNSNPLIIINSNWLHYLRPMSSMKTEEEYEYHQCKNIDYLEICEMEHTEMLKATALCFSRATDWLNKNGFDYRGLIHMGLALEATKDMYKN